MNHRPVTSKKLAFSISFSVRKWE